MMPYLLVACGSALGGVARFWLNNAVESRCGVDVPWGTLLINALGSLMIGLVAGVLNGVGSGGANGESWRQFAAVGVLGGFTTFSAFSLQTVSLLRDGRQGAACAYALGSVLLCVAAAAAGLSVVRLFRG